MKPTPLHPDTVSGAWVFRGTRVPVATLFENLRDGATIDQFLKWFPGVTRAQVEAVLNYEVQTLTAALDGGASKPVLSGKHQ